MPQRATWKGWILRNKQVTVTTWKFRLLVFLTMISLLYLTRPVWLVAIGSSLLHKEEELAPAEVILLENFDTEYSVFETAQGLLRAGYSSRIVAPVRAPAEATQAGSVENSFVEVMSRAAGIEVCETLPVQHIEPVSLNVARQLASFFEKEKIHSVLVVSPGFRSARSYLVYSSVFTPKGIRVQCLAAPTAGAAADSWWHTWHGVQDTCLELGKLLYYRFWVL